MASLLSADAPEPQAEPMEEGGDSDVEIEGMDLAEEEAEGDAEPDAEEDEGEASPPATPHVASSA